MIIRAGRRDGIAIFVVISLLFLLAVAFIPFFTNSLRLRKTTVNLLEEEIASSLALIGAEIFWDALEDVIENRKGCEKLFPEDFTQSPINLCVMRNPHGLIIKPEDLHNGSEILAAIDRARETNKAATSLHVWAEWVAVDKSSGDASTGRMPWQHGRIEVNIDCRIHANEYKFKYPVDYRLMNIIPPVTSRFTLFVVGRNEVDCEKYNFLLRDFENKSPDGKKFLRLFNHVQPYRGGDKYLKEAGWVYHGGNGVFLNIDGTHPNLADSEFFLFWPRFAQGSDLPSAISEISGTNLKLRVFLTGAMSEWIGAPFVNTLTEDSAREVEKTSVLKLSGSKALDTPTRVVGKVYARFVLLSSLIYDSNGDGIPDNITDASGNTQRAIFPLPKVNLAENYMPPFFPVAKTNRNDIDLFETSLQGIPSGMADVFPAYGDYAANMTKLSTDFDESLGFAAYNSIFDLFENGLHTGETREFPPKIRKFPAECYPDSGKNFEIIDDSNTKVFSGDLRSFEPDAHLSENMRFVTNYYDSETVFLNHIAEEENCFVISRPGVMYINGNLSFSKPLKVSVPVSIIASGSITIGDVNVTDNGRCVLWAMNGDIIIRGSRINASLNAPNGTLRNMCPFDLSGNLAVNYIDEQQLAIHGGEIHYDPKLNPVDSKQRFDNYIMILGPKIPRCLKRNTESL